MVIYLDYNATTPVDIAVQNRIISVLKENWANPSSSYQIGKNAKEIIDTSRSVIAKMIGSSSEEIIFTSCGTESNNMVIHTAVKYFKDKIQNDITSAVAKKPHIITTNIEHYSIREPLESLVKAGKIEATYVPVSKLNGSVNIDDIISAVRPNTCLITVMLANNETGVLQPVSDINDYLKSHNLKHILLHSDAAQAIGKVPVDVKELGVDYLTICGHKFYGPRIGALYFKKASPVYPMLFGGGQEVGLRPGTENTCMIAGLGKAAELVLSNLERYQGHMIKMRNYLEDSLERTFKDKVILNFKLQARLPNTACVTFDFDMTGKQLLDACDVCASTGAACHDGETPSLILVASGVTEILASKTVRLSVGKNTTKEDIDAAVQNFKEAIDKLPAKIGGHKVCDLLKV